ncbi:hypothetical protein HS5_05330 [Acidianus sp. HS-5]|nr:hypothetical protein HS5_05330 [Acidianus sp. HS-5]
MAIPKMIDARKLPKKRAIIVKVSERPKVAGIKPIAYFTTAVFEENHSVKIDLGLTDIRTCVLRIVLKLFVAYHEVLKLSLFS